MTNSFPKKIKQKNQDIFSQNGPLRSENSDVYMKWKIVGEVKLGQYADADCSDPLFIPFTR